MGKLFRRDKELAITVPEEIDDQLREIAARYFRGNYQKVWQFAIKMAIFENQLDESGGEIFIKDSETGEVTSIVR